MTTYDAYCKNAKADLKVIIRGIKADNERAAAATIHSMNPELTILAIRQSINEDLQELSPEELLNRLIEDEYACKDTTRLRNEILRRMHGMRGGRQHG